MIKGSYRVPVFHIVNANKTEINTVFTVLETLIKSNICCCIVRRGDEEKTHLFIDVMGNVPHAEVKQIFHEVIQHYQSDETVSRISVNEI